MASGMAATVAGGAVPLVELQDLRVHFPIRRGLILKREVGSVRAVDGISLAIRAGETVGLVGESGCGKTTTGLALLRLVQPTGGRVRFAGQDLTRLDRAERQRMRRRMAMVFQDPYASLNPRMTIGNIIADPLRVHGLARGVALRARVRELLEIVGLDPVLVNRFPHQFSGGQRQRVGIARALAVDPQFIVCDEPVSALDVSIQAQVLNLLVELQQRFHLTYLFISHDLAVVRHISTSVAVMYLGKIVEWAGTDALFVAPRHPYTQALLGAVHVPNPELERRRPRVVLRGDPPNPAHPPAGCHFCTRCPLAVPRCAVEEPPLREAAGGHWVACHLVEAAKPVVPKEE